MEMLRIELCENCVLVISREMWEELENDFSRPEVAAAAFEEHRYYRSHPEEFL